jgi:hypothetical protein
MIGLGQVKINNQIIAVVPNSVNRKKGRGDVTVEPQSLGAGDVDVVESVDVTTMKSMFSFSLKPTPANMELVDEWKLNPGLNVIEYIPTEGSVEVYESMSVINDPEYPDSNDGVIELEFEGQPLIK